MHRRFHHASVPRAATRNTGSCERCWRSYPQGRLATVGILGNHDYGHGWGDPLIAARVVSEAERAGVRILRNEVLAVSGLDIIGIDDLWARRGDPVVALSARESGAGLVLVHNPDAADEELWPGYRGWMLAGHTHGGQCKPHFCRHHCCR